MPEQRPSEIAAFIEALPDPDSARVFLDRLDREHPDRAARARRDPTMLGRLLTLAAHSPLLAETMLSHTEYIDWLKRESEIGLDRVKSTEQFREDLARFLTRSIDLGAPARLSRFKRRELLRIYLRDCLRVATLSEVTEELSNLADVILGHALALAEQEMINRHGAPLTRDERGRIAAADFAIVSLGKLGCRELNYASDIDLLFLYTGRGETSRREGHSVVTNKEFFTAVAQRVTQIVGTSGPEPAAYRIDLRLRPYGRDGDLVWEAERAADYYRNNAQNWERQALIRARASAGSHPLVARFLEQVRDVVFDKDALPHALADVRRAKEKIDRQEASRGGGFNVKLGPGGIREVEFIAQALQLAHGGREPWVRSSQTLIVLARLAEKGFLTEQERTRLSAAYTFLRTVEHRLQMEHGAQTHSLPLTRERLALIAGRCGYLRESDPAARLLSDLEAHTAGVRAVYNRVFAEPRTEAEHLPRESEKIEREFDDEIERLAARAASAISKLTAADEPASGDKDIHALPGPDELSRSIKPALRFAINPQRSLRNLTHWAESLSTYDYLDTRQVRSLLCADRLNQFLERLVAVLSSHYLSNILTAQPTLADVMCEDSPPGTTADFLRKLRAAVDQASDPASKSDALRQAWYRLVIGIGYRDMAGVRGKDEGGRRKDEDGRLKVSRGSNSSFIPHPSSFPKAPAGSLRKNNLEQTALAEAALHLTVELALDSLGLSGDEARALPFAIFALGRLGHTGMDYGSDLDLLVVFDDEAEWPPARQQATARFATASEFYAKLTAELVRVLASVTRGGFLYRIDLRLRPDGQSGPLAQGLGALSAYLSARASAWEHSAYLKAREVAGDLRFGARARKSICDAVFEGAARNPSLKEDLAAMRARLEREKARPGRRDIKWGRGAMTDVYFVTRYLQLRDRIYYGPEHGTQALIAYLGERGHLDEHAARALFDGYWYLRKLDHWIRMLLDRPTSVLPASQVALGDIARALGLGSAEEVERQYAHHTTAIREVYTRVLGS
jgi:[glutamine synthetase] adenylyltransferase / [glutamine synthetase]-adenylyl-L-tyrosine phosphorylase